MAAAPRRPDAAGRGERAGRARLSPADPPLILTLSFEPAVQDRFEALRRRHFPAERNFIPAHVTMFHALPGDAADEACAGLEAIASEGGFSVEVTGLRSLGRGVAFTLASPALAARRAAFARRFAGRLTRQDAQPWRPHLTVQNKVEPRIARETLGALSSGFTPHPARAGAFHLWRYLGGPWEALRAAPLD